jgi:hypothetical protein
MTERLSAEQEASCIGIAEDMASQILAEVPAPEGRWGEIWEAFCGCMQALPGLALLFRAPLMTVLRAVGAPLAERIIGTLGAPPIAELEQALVYFAAPTYRAAAVAWQREHQEALLELQKAHPDIDLFGWSPIGSA